MEERENIHAATDPEKCHKMAKKYRWELKRVEPTGDPTLKVNCIFKGEQTSWWNLWKDTGDKDDD